MSVFLIIPCVLHHHISNLPSIWSLIIFGKEYKLWRFSLWNFLCCYFLPLSAENLGVCPSRAYMWSFWPVLMHCLKSAAGNICNIVMMCECILSWKGCYLFSVQCILSGSKLLLIPDNEWWAKSVSNRSQMSNGSL